MKGFISNTYTRLCMNKSSLVSKKSPSLDTEIMASEAIERLETLRVERESLGVEVDSVASFIDMVAEEDVNEALEIIGKLARLQK